VSAAAPQRVLITGVAGQDGSYLAELLAAEGLELHGIVRRSADGESPNLDAVRDSLTLHVADLQERGTLRAVIAGVEPDEIYHLAAPTFVPDSWVAAAETMQSIATVTGELVDAVRDHLPRARVVVATSREIFGSAAPSPQSELTPCIPSSPYGAAKLAAHQLVGLIRAHDGLHLSSAILFNHESPRRDPRFISRKVTRAAAAISLGRQDELTLGDTEAVRDWSAAGDVVRGLRLMAAAPEPDDYVFASGVGRTVRELVDVAFACVGLEPERHLRVDPALVRPREHAAAIGDAARARERLGWRAETSFEELIAAMVAADLAAIGSR
jgi:GDPmannose 4,6-dehydratase